MTMTQILASASETELTALLRTWSTQLELRTAAAPCFEALCRRWIELAEAERVSRGLEPINWTQAARKVVAAARKEVAASPPDKPMTSNWDPRSVRRALKFLEAAGERFGRDGDPGVGLVLLELAKVVAKRELLRQSAESRLN